MKIGILICTYNRPEYLQQCFDSLMRTRIPEGTVIYIVDDASTDQETKKLINGFTIPNIVMGKFFKKQNRSIKDSLIVGCDLLWKAGVDIITNIDSDAIVSNDFLETLLELKLHFPEHLITGFNCLTRNNDGSERHKILMEGDGFNLKKSVGGLNMVFDEHQYNKWIRPTLQKSIEQNLNWDDHTCRASMKDNREIVCAVPSVCQHIGFISSMGHATTEKPDTADDFKSVHLPDVTLIAVDDNADAIIKAADKSCNDILFGSVKLLSSMPSNDKRVIPIRKLGSKKEYSIFLLKEIVDYINTPFFITIQADGFILDGKKWNDEWLQWDYIGSPWHWYNDGMNVGNGAMSLRSKRLHEILKSDENIVPKNDHLIKEYQEDHNICRIYRSYLEVNHNIKFAPLEVAERFGIEAWNVSPPYNKYSGQFGFHGGSIDFSEANLSYIPYIKK